LTRHSLPGTTRKGSRSLGLRSRSAWTRLARSCCLLTNDLNGPRLAARHAFCPTHQVQVESSRTKNFSNLVARVNAKDGDFCQPKHAPSVGAQDRKLLLESFSTRPTAPSAAIMEAVGVEGVAACRVAIGSYMWASPEVCPPFPPPDEKSVLDRACGGRPHERSTFLPAVVMAGHFGRGKCTRELSGAFGALEK